MEKNKNEGFRASGNLEIIPGFKLPTEIPVEFLNDYKKGETEFMNKVKDLINFKLK